MVSRSTVMLTLACVAAASLLSISVAHAENVCTLLNACSGHGTCTDLTKRCACFNGFGSSTDTYATPIKPDCSERVCPVGAAWSDIPTAADSAHALTECSSAGICNRAVGICSCFAGFEGSACHLSTCSHSCSGHGQCMTLARMSTMSNAMPPIANTVYGGLESTTTWDQDKIRGCVCDSSWTVGLASGETQLSEYFGPGCRSRRCPSGNDPMTTADETDCENVLQDHITEAATAAPSTGGASGNLCHVSCSNRGICDYETAMCECFTGYSGQDCGTQNVLAL